MKYRGRRAPCVSSKLITVPVFSLSSSTLPCALRAQSQPAAPEAESAAIKQTCADFSENFTRHDAHGVAMTFADDADFTNMRGIHSHGRKDIEKWFSGLFRGNLKDSVRTDTVRSIRYFSPELAAVDADTVITGTKAADGSVIPARKGSDGCPDGQEKRALVHRHVSRIGISRGSPGPGEWICRRFLKINSHFNFKLLPMQFASIDALRNAKMFRERSWRW